MSLQRRLAKGISAVLAVIIIFMALTSMSYWDIEGFVTTILPVNITIAKSYERLAGRWNYLGEYAGELQKNNLTVNASQSLIVQEIDQIVARLENLVTDEQRQNSLKQIKILCASFTRQLSSFELLINNRNSVLRKNSDRRLKAAQGLRSEVINLLDRFKSMIVDLNTTLKNPDFQASLGGTSSLIEKISRIEKDLILAETEIALYLSLKNEKDSTGNDSKTGKTSAARVENRLRAILFLLARSIQESQTTLHKRVLSQVESKIRSFYDSFLKLRNILEAPESELIELEDHSQRILQNLLALKQQGIANAATEAEFFWSRIFSGSDELRSSASQNHRLILAFLLIVLGAGIYLNTVVPKRIGGPLEQLSNQISSFKLGSETIAMPVSGTEEIDALGKSFQLMAQRLNLQAEVNRNYLESIHSLTNVYRELHETKKRIDSPNERLEKPIGLILQQLISQCPSIDLVKVMIIRDTAESTGKNSSANKKEASIRRFARLGEPEFSERFKASHEFKPYCVSTGYNYEDPLLSDDEEIPMEGGLTGWAYENSPGIKTTADDISFFQPVYSPVPIGENLILQNRDFEKGLNGCLVTENLNVPGQDSDEKQNERGLLFVYFLSPATKLSWQEIFFIQIIASQIASIIETDTLLQEHDLKKKMDDQLTMAREIQENLLPQSVPQINGLHISKISESAAEVGGDYYDFFDLGENRLGIVIADASGKNVPAAIIMTVFKTTLSTMDLAHMKASEVLTRANTIIAKNITNDRFITAMYVIIDAVTGQIELSSAGHNPAFVVSGRGMDLILHEKNVKCLPLGIMEDYNYDSINLSLKKGDLLFLYTDGVTEARNVDEEEFGVSGLKKFLAKPRGKDPAKDLMAEITNFSRHSNQHDDITAVSIEFTGRK
jgi:serine phosphatase RsbU (regulator of sigma subunit)/HAMP domain-containing protein